MLYFPTFKLLDHRPTYLLTYACNAYQTWEKSKTIREWDLMTTKCLNISIFSIEGGHLDLFGPDCFSSCILVDLCPHTYDNICQKSLWTMFTGSQVRTLSQVWNAYNFCCCCCNISDNKYWELKTIDHARMRE